jgi:hypothetical protein
MRAATEVTDKDWWMEVTVEIRIQSPKPITESKAFDLAARALADAKTDQITIGTIRQEKIRPLGLTS